MAADHSKDRRGGRRVPHYYTPREVKLVPGVTHKETINRDLYVGEAEDLVASGLLTADMFPAPEAGSIAWHPVGWHHGGDSEGCITVRRSTGIRKFVVEIWCGIEEMQRRQQEDNNRREQRREQYRREQELLEEPREQQEFVEIQDLAPDERAVIEVHRKMPGPFKPVALVALQEIAKATSDAEKTCWLNVWRACCAAANHGMPAAARTRGHLRLAWSAPEAPAWTSDL